MNLLILPLTAVAPLKRTPGSIAVGMGILVVCIGTPLAFVATKPYREPAFLSAPPVSQQGRGSY